MNLGVNLESKEIETIKDRYDSRVDEKLGEP
jgi:hypothetical protein